MHARVSSQDIGIHYRQNEIFKAKKQGLESNMAAVEPQTSNFLQESWPQE